MVVTSFAARGHTDSVACLALGDSILASGGDDGNVYFWSLGQSSFPIQHTPRVDSCSAVKFDVDKSDIVYSAHGRRICTWDLRNLRRSVSEWEANEEEVNCLDVLKGESRLAAADDSGAVQIFNTYNGEVVRTLKKHDNICAVAKFRPMRSWQLISGGLDCRVIVSDWKGTGLGVIIFELDEIIDCDLFGEPQPGTDNPSDLSNRSSESHASTSENAEVEDDEFEADDEAVDPDERQLTSQASPGYPGLAPIPVSRVNPGSERNSAEREGDQSHTSQTYSQQPSSEWPATSGTPPTSFEALEAWSSGLPINPPMVHSLACSASGDFVAAGLEKSTIELFSGDGKRLAHSESLYGHRRAVSALHFIGDSHLISGGNDCRLFLWTLGVDTDGQQFVHDAKVNAIEGRELQKIYVADYSPVIRLLDLSVC